MARGKSTWINEVRHGSLGCVRLLPMKSRHAPRGRLRAPNPNHPELPGISEFVGVTVMDLSNPRFHGRAGSPAPLVIEFHRAFQLPLRLEPAWDGIDSGLRDLRIDLLAEEVSEYRQAALQGDLIGVADALADIVYVAYGAAISYGIDLDAVIAEVHRANMSKLGPDGRPVLRADGKVLKAASYRPPDVEAILRVAGRRARASSPS